MRREVLTSLPVLILSLVSYAGAEDNPDFPQIHAQPNPGHIRPQLQPNPDFGSQNMAGVPNANQGPSANGGQVGGNNNNAAGASAGPSGSILHNNVGGTMSPPPDSPDPAPGPMSEDDALANFTTVVETYVSNKSPKGYWSFVEKEAGKKPVAWRLTTPEVQEDSVKKLAGEKYSGRVKLSDVRGVKPPELQFVVDFSGVKWKVLSVKRTQPAD